MTSLLLKKKSTSQPQIPLSEDAKQAQLLSDAKKLVQSQSFQMNRALDVDNLLDALKHASHLISELRTNNLTPKTYYALYIYTVDQLRYLEAYITDGNHNLSLLDLYEMIQYAGNILPRLYLLVTVGSIFIKKMGAPAKDLLKDMVELCRGVQHPTRGLFLRTYLSEMTKDKLPDEGTKYEGDIMDSIDFILINFTEMNKLWVRMQHGILNMEKREKEREELNVLVGKNLARLSQLEGLTVELYKNGVLSRILEQIVSCKDRIAQQYLMIIIIQVFSDDFHLQTLSQLLDILPKLEEGVKVHMILTPLISRLSSFCSSESGYMPQNYNLFELFKNHVENLVKSRSSISLEYILEMINSLLTLSLKCYKENLDYVDLLFDFASGHIKEKRFNTDSKNAINQAMKLLQQPMDTYRNIRPVLSFTHYSSVLNLLPFKERRQIAINMVECLISNNIKIPTADEVGLLLNFLTPLIKRGDDMDDFSDEDWHSDQTRVAKALNMFYNTEVEAMFGILLKAKEYFAEGVKAEVSYTIVPLVYKSLQLVQTIHKNKDTDPSWEKKAKSVCKYANNAVSMIRATTSPTTTSATTMTAFHLYLQCALQADNCGLTKFAYDFLTQGALTIYEDEAMSQSQYEYDAIRQLIASVHTLSLKCFDIDGYSTLSRRIAQHSSKLKAIDSQTKATISSSHLFVKSVAEGEEQYRDAKSSIICLKKPVPNIQNLTDNEQKSSLLVEILDNYIYFFLKHPDVLEVVYVNAIIQKINKHIQENKISTQHPSSAHFRNIRLYVLFRQNWKNLIKKEKPPRDEDLPPEAIEVEGDIGLSESEAKKEASRWLEIKFED